MAMANPYNYSKPKGTIATRPQAVQGAQAAQGSQPAARSQTDVYLEQKVMAAKPEELTLMLYEGTIRFIKQAQQQIESKDMAKANTSLLRAQAIVNELQATLNMDYEVSNNLDSLYDFMISRLVDANIEKNVAILDEVLEIATEMRDTWKEAMTLI